MDFIPILSFYDYIEANIILGRLQGEGINCWLKDENSATITPFFSNSIGGIKLMVASAQATRALELVELFKNNSAGE